MPDILVMVSPVTTSMSVAAITHVTLMLIVLIPRAAMTVTVKVDSMVTAMNVPTSMNVIMVQIHVMQMLLVRIMSGHTHVTVMQDTLVTVLSALTLTNVKCHHVMIMQLAKILLVVSAVNVMMVSTVMKFHVSTLMNVQRLISDSINVANLPRVLILLAHMIVNVPLGSKVMATIAVTSMNVSLRLIIVLLMLGVMIH